MVPEQIQKKYLHRLNSVKAQRIFAVAILLPFAPDDALCMLAGLTTMPFTRFLAILLLCKPISIVLYSLGFMSLSLTSLF